MSLLRFFSMKKSSGQPREPLLRSSSLRGHAFPVGAGFKASLRTTDGHNSAHLITVALGGQGHTFI